MNELKMFEEKKILCNSSLKEMTSHEFSAIASHG